MKNRFFIKRIIIALLLTATWSGCLTNYYDRYYINTEGLKQFESIHGDAPVVLKNVTTENDVLDLIEDGYVSVGYSSFHGPYTPLSCAVDTAEKVGAALVLLDIRFKETKQYTSIMFLPSYSTTYTSGSLNLTTYGQGGPVYGYGTYSGSSTTRSMNAVPIQRNTDIYNHDAMFFKKIDTSKLYGVSWFVPKRLPNEQVNAPITVRVLAVYHGSKAESDGIKRGQIVKKVNGVLIKTREDIAPFMNNEIVVREIEVEDAT